MTFVQVLEFDSKREQEIEALMEQYRAEMEGRSTVSQWRIARDHSRPDHYTAIVEFPSYEEAMRNSNMPETGRMAQQMQALCDGPIRYLDLDIINEGG